MPPPSLPSNGRILGIDLARSVAILGMVFVNYWIVLTGFRDDGTAASYWPKQCSGRASALFVVLAGVGISLLTARARGADGDSGSARRQLFKRALFLFVIGLAFFPIWPGDILHYYGVYLAIAAAVITAPTKLLWALCPIGIASFVGLSFALDYSAGWTWWNLEYPQFWEPLGFARNLFFNGFHPVVPWIAFLFAGMAIGRADLTRRRTRLVLVLVGAATFGLAMGSAELFRSMLDNSMPRRDVAMWTSLLGTGSMPPMPFYVLQAGGLAVAILGVCLELGVLVPRVLLSPLLATGQLALTLYVAHILVLGVLEESSGELGGFSASFALRASLWFFGGSIVFSSLWRWRFRHGPLEWVMRRVSG